MVKKVFTIDTLPGVQRDGTIFDMNFYTDALWVRFQRGRPRKIGGYRAITSDAQGYSRGLYVNSVDGNNQVFNGYNDGLEVVNIDNNGIGSGIQAINILRSNIVTVGRDNARLRLHQRNLHQRLPDWRLWLWRKSNHRRGWQHCHHRHHYQRRQLLQRGRLPKRHRRFYWRNRNWVLCFGCNRYRLVCPLAI
jgi:hypothetical protein